VWYLKRLVSHWKSQHMVYHSPDWLVGAFVDADERGKSARSILLTLHDDGEGTAGGGVLRFREQHMRKSKCV